MVTKRDLNQLEMSLDEYFEYIVESRVNGQHEQSKLLFEALSEDQRKEFFDYTYMRYFYEVDYDEFVSEMIEFRKYFTNQ